MAAARRVSARPGTTGWLLECACRGRHAGVMSDSTHIVGYAALDVRREQMLEAISGYSEDRWAAGWLNGIETQIRKIGGLWLVMAAACSGWPVGYRAEHGWEPLNEAELAALALMSDEAGHG